MTRRTWTIVAVILACASAAGYAARLKLLPQLPIKDNLVEAVRAEIEIKDRNQDEYAYCIQPPVDYPQPDARTRIRMFGWHADYIKASVSKPDRARQVEKLDALAAVGLFSKEDVTVAVPGAASEPAWRYKLTVEGWVHQNQRGNCFVFGRPTLLDYVGNQEVVHNGEKVRNVQVRVGVAGLQALAPWAQDERVRRAFPEIDEMLKGKVTGFHVHLRNGRWRGYRQPDEIEMSLEALPEDQRKQILARAALPDPSRADIERAMSKFPHRSCLVLPGSEKLPTDKVYYNGLYRFGIYLDKDRPAYDQVAKKTAPVVERLLAVGAVVRLGDEQVVGEGVDKGRVFSMAVYALAPHLQALYDDNCISLGPLTHEFVDVRYRTVNQFGLPTSSFTFKKIVRLESPPKALTDEVLLAAWPDLRGILEHGHACSGGFDYDKQTGDSGGGAATCWYAFDSLYENY